MTFVKEADIGGGQIIVFCDKTGVAITTVTPLLPSVFLDPENARALCEYILQKLKKQEVKE